MPSMDDFGSPLFQQKRHPPKDTFLILLLFCDTTTELCYFQRKLRYLCVLFDNQLLFDMVKRDNAAWSYNTWALSILVAAKCAIAFV